MTSTAKANEIKRLQPTGEVLRELFLKSGNLCAFPGCSHPIMSQEGIMVAQICHIEAADEGGERFNKEQTNEQRRRFANLILLCYAHHQETNDVAKFDAQRMRAMKASHEQKVFNFIEKTLLSVDDQTKLNNPRPTKDCGRLNELLNWKHTPEDLAGDAKCLNEMLDRLNRVPKPARQLFVIIIERATPFFGQAEVVPTTEILHACGLDEETLKGLCFVLDKYGFINDAGPDESGQGRISLPALDGWMVWEDFRAFVRTGFGTMHELIVDLNFSLLDRPAQQDKTE